MQVTEKWLKGEYVCAEGLDWFLNQSETDLYKLINKLIEEKHENGAKLYTEAADVERRGRGAFRKPVKVCCKACWRYRKCEC